MNLLIGSDLVPTKVNNEEFIKGETNPLLGNELSEFWFGADYRIFNLETPLSDEDSPIIKKGPNLIAPSKTINGIRKLKPSLVTLANNHILDHDKIGLDNTIKLLENSNINHIGAGNNLEEARKPFIINHEDMIIGVYTCAEQEFTIATDTSSGANPFDPFESLDHIVELKEKCDYVIVIYHGGKEHYRYPSPYLQKACRKMVDKGADLVVCQHSHTIGAFEKYNERTIVYGQGNFIFNKNKNEHWNTGLLLKVKIKDDLKVEYIPFIRTNKGIKIANKQQSKSILDGFYTRSKEILEEGFIEKNYKKFAEENIVNYLRAISSQGKWMSRIDRKILGDRLIKRSYKKDKLLSLNNYIECEAHRELFLRGIKENLTNEQ